MKAIGIVCEYNPFHNGHLYQIQKIKEKYPDYVLVAVMSGNFVERGEVAIIDKWKRAEIALKSGIDLVVELPFPFATQSADFFAYGAITILEYLHVEKVIFGSEGNSIDDLYLLAKTQLNNPDFDSLVRYYSKMGKNYPTALSAALEELTGKKVDAPNDLLGISYIKTILAHHYHILPESILRTTFYHDTSLQDEVSSATSIRSALQKGESVRGQVPNIELEYLKDCHFMESYFSLLQYKIISDDLTKYQSVEEGIDSLLKKEVLKVNSYEEFVHAIKSRRYTYNKIRRMLLHILCNFTKDLASEFQTIPYIRLLGFNVLGKKYLNDIKKKVEVPIISKVTRDKDKMLDFEIQTTFVYDIIHNKKLGKKEFEKILIVGEDNNDKE